jgi:hypothetical protein
MVATLATSQNPLKKTYLDMIVCRGKKGLNCSVEQLKLLLFGDMIVPRGKKSLSCFPRQLKLLLLEDMIVP